jgi:hypothetical protein
VEREMSRERADPSELTAELPQQEAGISSGT